MSDLILIVFIILYFLIEVLHDHHVILDLGRNQNAYNADRKAWHFYSTLQSGVVLLLLSSIIILDLHFNINAYKFILLFIFIRWLSLDQFLNFLRGKNLFYVEVDNKFSGAVRWFSDKILLGMPVEITMICLKLILLILIIVL